MDLKTGVLMRDSKATKMNPYDLSAIEAALQLRETYGGWVTSFTMGPKSAEEVLIHSFSMGVDDGVLLTDFKFAGADVYATSYTLANGMSMVDDYDLIICGKQTTDGDTGQVGPSLAEHLGIPHVYSVSSIDNVEGEQIFITEQLGNKKIQLKIDMPCLLVIHQEAFRPRLPSLKLKLLSKKKPITERSLKDMKDKTPLRYGLNGSPTQVERIFLPEKTTHQEVLTGDADTLTLEIFNRLKQYRLI